MEISLWTATTFIGNHFKTFFRVVFTTILLAIKYIEDIYYCNEYYSRVAGISLEELNSLEGEMLDLLDFSLYVHPTLFKQYKNKIKQSVEEPIRGASEPYLEENTKKAAEYVIRESMNSPSSSNNFAAKMAS